MIWMRVGVEPIRAAYPNWGYLPLLEREPQPMASRSEAKSLPSLRADAQRNRDGSDRCRQVSPSGDSRRRWTRSLARGRWETRPCTPLSRPVPAGGRGLRRADGRVRRGATAALEEQDSWRGFAGFVTFLCRCQAQDEASPELLTDLAVRHGDELARHRRAVLEHLDSCSRALGRRRPAPSISRTRTSCSC